MGITPRFNRRGVANTDREPRNECDCAVRVDRLRSVWCTPRPTMKTGTGYRAFALCACAAAMSCAGAVAPSGSDASPSVTTADASVPEPELRLEDFEADFSV